MSLGTILLVVLVLVLLGVIPTWPHSREWGYAPSGVVGLVLIVLLVLFLMGRIEPPRAGPPSRSVRLAALVIVR